MILFQSDNFSHVWKQSYTCKYQKLIRRSTRKKNTCCSQKLRIGVKQITKCLITVTWVHVSGRDPNHWLSRVSVLGHSGVVDALSEDRRLVVHVPHLHCESLGGGERRQAVVHCTDSETVETLGLIVQRGREKQEACQGRRRRICEPVPQDVVLRLLRISSAAT